MASSPVAAKRTPLISRLGPRSQLASFAIVQDRADNRTRSHRDANAGRPARPWRERSEYRIQHDRYFGSRKLWQRRDHYNYRAISRRCTEAV